jgi:polyferredoxin
MDPNPSSTADASAKKALTKNAKAEDGNAIQLALLQAFVAVIVFIPFMDRPWAPYAAALTAYTVLVFGMAFRDAECSLRKPEVRNKLPGFLLLHMLFLAVVYAIVNYSIRLTTQLPAFMARAGRKGSLFDWIVTFALVLLAWQQEHWMRRIIRRGLNNSALTETR